MSTLNQRRSISPRADPSRALRECPDVGRSASSSSWASQTSAGADASSRKSRESIQSSSSRHSSGSYTIQPNGSFAPRNSSRRRGFMRPQGTDFAASAKARESVMSLGSIAHLQYYFARTGILDGKGGQFTRKRQPQATLDLSALEGNGPTAPRGPGSDADSSYASMDSSSSSSSPDVASIKSFGLDEVVCSPTAIRGRHHDDDHDDHDDRDNDEGDLDDNASVYSFISEPDVLPPTVSTYNHKKHVIQKPPTVPELQADLEASLRAVQRELEEVRARKAGTFEEPPDAPRYPNMPAANTQGWFELQGMRILDVVTLSIRAAKLYYSAHELPDRLDAIKPEKQVRTDLLGAMEVLKQIATRNFQGGLRDDELAVLTGWADSVFDILRRDAEIEAAEQAERRGWAWLAGDWTGRELERERQFLASMDPTAEPLPDWTPVSASLSASAGAKAETDTTTDTTTDTNSSQPASAPTPFLACLQDGLRLVQLHNAAVKKSRRRFGAIPTFHVDTQKPYRCADNLRYWAKAAELRFEVVLSIDALGIVYSTGPKVWVDFEAALLKWCRRVREEITVGLV